MDYKKVFGLLLDENFLKSFCIYLNTKLYDKRYEECEAHGDKRDYWVNEFFPCEVVYYYSKNRNGEVVSVNIELYCYSGCEKKEFSYRKLLNIHKNCGDHYCDTQNFIDVYLCDLMDGKIVYKQELILEQIDSCLEQEDYIGAYILQKKLIKN